MDTHRIVDISATHPSAAITPAALLEIARESEQEYTALRAEFPPGTVHDGRNDARLRMDQALACAQWMEQGGHASLTYVGPFGKLPFVRGSRVRIRKGAVVHSTKPGTPREGVQARSAHVVTLHSVDRGYVRFDGEEKVHQPCVSWAGTGGYWRRADANDVELVPAA